MANMGPAAGRPPIKDDSVGPGLQQSMDQSQNLATFIYDYFVKKGKVELASAMLNSGDLGVRTRPRQKKSPNSGVNGVDEMDMEPKDDLTKKIESLPEADIQEQMPKNAFLEDWWSVFWDIWSAGKGRRSSAQAAQYLQQNNANRTIMQQRMMQQQTMMNNMRANMNPANMNRMNTDNLRMNAVNNQRMSQMRNVANMGPQGQPTMQGDMGNQQRPQSPMSSDNAPSPKRARTGDAPFGNPQMGVGAQNRPVGMQMPGPPGQQPGMGANGLDMQNGPFSNMPGNPQARMAQFPAMNGRFPNVKENFQNGNQELLLEDMNLFNSDGMARNMGANGSQQGGALADYQMQLMLLEQQNKKRLLMARQEQEVTSQGGGPPGATGGMMGAGGPGAGASPRPDGQMPMARGSPAPGFDPSQMAPAMGNQFAFNPQMTPNGMRPGGPGFQGPAPMQATMEQIRARGPMPPGNWAGGQGMPPNNMGPGQQPGQNNNQNTMPPPSAPNAGPNAGRTNPSSPAPGANPPTPQQNKNSNAKNNKKENAPKDTKKAKASGKKATNNPTATPSSEAEGNGPPTPTPPTPITPSAPNNPFKNGQPGQNMPGQNNGQMPQQSGVPGQPDAGQMNAGIPFGQLSDHHPNNDMDFSGIDFGVQDTSDVLEAFDFESFLNADTTDTGFNFEPNAFNMNGDGVDVNARE